MKIFSYPSRAASLILLSICPTGRISPLRPTSAAKQCLVEMGSSKLDERMAAATARSHAGSLTLSPPAIFKKTSLAESLNPALFSSTARSILSRLASNPVALRCGIPYAAVETSDWISIRKGLVPSSMLPTAIPLRLSSCTGVRISEGLATSLRPLPVISNIAISAVEPNLFFMLLSIR